jgi:8-oxo-dGTP diphosphatase
VLREKLYNLLGLGASVCFHLLNLLLRGNLPPFGSVCVVVKKGERYLLLERSSGKMTLPGGFMRWREEPQETARRECREETGLEVRVGERLDSGYLVLFESYLRYYEQRATGQERGDTGQASWPATR